MRPMPIAALLESDLKRRADESRLACHYAVGLLNMWQMASRIMAPITDMMNPADC